MNEINSSNSWTKDIITDEKSENRSFYDRIFSPLGKDSLRGGVFVMLLTALGTGMFSLHHLFDSIGIVWGTLFFAIVGLNYIFCCNNIAKAILNSKERPNSLNDLVNKYFGVGFMRFYNAIFLFYNLVALICLILALTKTTFYNFEGFIKTIVSKWFDIPKDEVTFQLFNKFAVWVFGFFLFFLNLQKSVDKLRYFSLVSVAIFVGIVVVCLTQTHAYYSAQHESNTYNLIDFDFWKFLETFGLPIYSFNCVTNIFGVFKAVKNPNPRRLTKIFNYTFFSLFLLYLVYTLSSYLSLGTKYAPSTDLFIFRKPLDENDKDIVMSVFRGLLIISLFVGFSINTNPLKIFIYEQFTLGESSITNVVVTFLLTFIPIFIGGFFTEISKYANLGGVFCAMTIAFTVPALLIIKLDVYDKPWQRLLLIYWLMLLIVLTCVGTYMSVLDVFKPKQ